MVDAQQQRVESLGPAERIVQALIGFTDHLYHGRPGIVTPSANALGLEWSEATTHALEGKTTVYRRIRKGAGTKVTVPGREKPVSIPGLPLGELAADGRVLDGARVKVAEFRKPGLFPEVAAWMYRQVAEVWKLDNEFAAKWASYAYAQDDSKDRKVVLAAFLMVQSRKGDPVMDQGVVAFHDDDFRDVGEAMALYYDKTSKGMDAKLLLRIHDLLSLPGIAEINRELGFGKSARHAFLGRWPATVRKWLGYRENNPQLLEGLVKAGYKESVKRLARLVGYKPESEKFYEVLRWKQVQSKDGRRSLAIGRAVRKADTWEGLSETEICQRIVGQKPSYKVITGLLPKSVGLTRAIMAAAVEAGSLSDKDLIIATPTLEDLGLLQVQDVRERWLAATRNAEDQRAANIARNVKSKDTKEVLQAASEVAVQNAIAEVVRGIRMYFLVDISGSMTLSIEVAKQYVAKILQAIPLDRVHTGVFQTVGREIKIKAASQAAVDQAFRGIVASGGTSYGAGVMSLSHHQPQADEDAIIIFVGDEEDNSFEAYVQRSGIRPVAFGFVRTPGPDHRRAVRDTAARLGIPCFMLDPAIFEDPYAVIQKLRALIAATPVGITNMAPPAVRRLTLVDQILATQLLQKPAWAA